LTKRCYYHKGVRHGEYKEFNYANLKEERVYSYGKIEGQVKIYYDNTKLMEESLYKNGVRDGVSKWFDQEGNLTIEYEYKNGELIKK
jgi:antitoxin component YwqK of YwqJK toxin-antitoxin module